jgi:alanine racemase
MSWLSRIFQFKKNLERPLSVLNEVLLSEKSLLDNYDYLQSLDENIELFPVLKSNAYGHGIEQVATILKKRNPRYIVLDSYYEALRVHEVNDVKILLIGYNLPENYPLMDFSWVTPVVTELQTLKVLGKLDRPITIHIKIDTGMRRQGILMDEIPEFLRIMNMYPKIKLE